MFRRRQNDTSGSVNQNKMTFDIPQQVFIIREFAKGHGPMGIRNSVLLSRAAEKQRYQIIVIS